MAQSKQSASRPDSDFLARHGEIVQGMARRMARQFRVTNELQDVIHTGIVGLVKAASTYRPDKGTERFWAWSCVRLEILSAYACGAHQHSGGDGYQWNSCRRPLNEALQKAMPAPDPELPPMPLYAALTPRQQRLIELIYDEGLSERAVVRARSMETRSRKRVHSEHVGALNTLRQALKPQSAA